MFTAGSIPRRGTNELEWGLLLSDVGTQETAVQASCVSMLDRPVVSQKNCMSKILWSSHHQEISEPSTISLISSSVANKAFDHETWVNDKRHDWKEWRYGHSSLAVDGKLDTSLSNCAIMDNYYVEQPVWMVDLGKKTNVNGIIALTWQGAGQGTIWKLTSTK